VHLQVLAREGRDRREVRVTRTDFPGSRSQGGTRRAAEAAQEEDAELAPEVALQNEQTAELNRRASAALVWATGAGIGHTPEQWWAWWNKKNEVFVAGEKPVVTQYQQRERNVSQAALQSSSEGGESLDCLAAETIVWTDRGEVAIEAIQVGDLVLSQHPETGELAYKPVLRTTVRPASRLIKLTAAGHEFSASGGHPFWVSGRGWIKARDLEAGMRLHGVADTILVEAIEPGDHQQTYNLVVADFHTYFAGADRALSHDNTIREPTERVVPGLVAK
jgi:hypothetical protein